MARILMTGAAGRIGTVARRGLAGRYELLRLTDIVPIAADGEGERELADLRDFDAVRRLMGGIDCVVHFGGQSTESTWDDVLHNGIAVSLNIFEAARLEGVKRVVYASSNHAVGFYPVDRAMGIDEPPRPDCGYGVAKVAGEAMGRLYADKHGLSVACLRIGSFRVKPGTGRELATWLSPSDLVHLVARCIEAPPYDFITVYGVSNNTRGRWSSSDAQRIGYHPVDDAEAYAAELAAAGLATDPYPFHGGRHAVRDVPPTAASR